MQALDFKLLYMLNDCLSASTKNSRLRKSWKSYYELADLNNQHLVYKPKVLPQAIDGYSNPSF